MNSAIVLAAGLSRRMGQPKLSLPWGKTTVLGQVLAILKNAAVDEILVVTGADPVLVETICAEGDVRLIHNADFEAGEMLSSIQVGLKAASEESEAALIVLGDQPGIEVQVVREILNAHRHSEAPIIVPSYDGHRGHPWLITRRFWAQVLSMRPPETSREFLNTHADQIQYVEARSPAILQDVDTPEDYLRSKP